MPLFQFAGVGFRSIFGKILGRADKGERITGLIVYFCVSVAGDVEVGLAVGVEVFFHVGVTVGKGVFVWVGACVGVGVRPHADKANPKVEVPLNLRKSRRDIVFGIIVTCFILEQFKLR